MFVPKGLSGVTYLTAFSLENHSFFSEYGRTVYMVTFDVLSGMCIK